MYCCTDGARSLAYKALVRPCIEYGSTVWSPHTAKNINLLDLFSVELLGGLKVNMTQPYTSGARVLMTV